MVPIFDAIHYVHVHETKAWISVQFANDGEGERERQKNQSHSIDFTAFSAFCAVLLSLLIVCFNSSFAGSVFLSLSENHIFIYSSSRIEWKKKYLRIGSVEATKKKLKWSSFSHFIGNWFLTFASAHYFKKKNVSSQTQTNALHIRNFQQRIIK